MLIKTLQVKVKKLSPNAVIPQYAKYGDAGLDLTCINMEIHDTFVRYDTGLAIEIPDGYVGLIFPRSSLHQKDLILSNHVGVIDSGYRGEIKFFFKKFNTNDGYIYNIGDRIGQLIILPYPYIELIETNELSDSERGENGFGSTG